MRSIKIIIILVLLFFMQSSLFATHQWMEVNRFTKQYSRFYSEDFLFYNPIGWEYKDEDKATIRCLNKMGYTETNFHYSLDLFILSILFIFTSIILVLVYNLKRKRSDIQ
jgi:hypothetical protein